QPTRRPGRQAPAAPLISPGPAPPRDPPPHSSCPPFDLGLRERWPEERALHGVERAVETPRMAEVLVVGRKRRADGPTSIARRRLDPNALEGAVAQHLSVSNAIERHAAGEAQVRNVVALG